MSLWTSNHKQFSYLGSQHISWPFVFLDTHMVMHLGGLVWNSSYCCPNKTLLFQKSENSVLTVLSKSEWGYAGNLNLSWVLSSALFSLRWWSRQMLCWWSLRLQNNIHQLFSPSISHQFSFGVSQDTLKTTRKMVFPFFPQDQISLVFY
jgi:hypothetical protein